jgi:hypothetical protein
MTMRPFTHQWKFDLGDFGAHHQMQIEGRFYPHAADPAIELDRLHFIRADGTLGDASWLLKTLAQDVVWDLLEYFETHEGGME